MVSMEASVPFRPGKQCPTTGCAIAPQQLCTSRSRQGAIVIQQRFAHAQESQHHQERSPTLEGMQPTLRHVPPSAPRPSTQATFMPSCAALMAAT